MTAAGSMRSASVSTLSSHGGLSGVELAGVAAGDVALMVLVTFLGAFAFGRLRATLASSAAASFIAGVAALTVSGAVFLAFAAALNVPLPAWLILVVLVLVTVGIGVRRGAGLRDVRGSAVSAAAAAPVFAALSLAVRAQDTLVSFTDSVVFMASASTIAAGRVDLALAEPTTFYSFPPGAKVTHALSFLYHPSGSELMHLGDGGLRPLGVALLAAVCVLMGSAVRQLTAMQPMWLSRVLSLAAPAALLTMETAVAIAHLNGSHATVSASLLLLAVMLLSTHSRGIPRSGAGGGLATHAEDGMQDSDAPAGSHPGYSTAALLWLLIAAVVLHRLEALMVVPLVLIPAYRMSVDRRLLASLWQALGLSLVAWSLVALAPFLRLIRDGGVVLTWAGDPVISLTLIISAGLVVFLAGIVSRMLPERLLLLTPPAGSLAILLGVSFYFVRDAESFMKSVAATASNLLPVAEVPAGGWRLSGFVVVGLILAAVVLRLFDRRAEVAVFSYPAVMFFPAMLVAAFVREGGYRVGFPDSLNRSWLHVLPLLLVAVASITSAAKERSTGSDTKDITPIRAKGVRLPSAALFDTP